MNRILSTKLQKIKLSIATKIVETVENNIEHFENKNEFLAQTSKLEGYLNFFLPLSSFPKVYN